MLQTCTILLFYIQMTVMESQPELWIETNHPQSPWENITLWCRIPSEIYSKSLLLKSKTQITLVWPTYKTFQASFSTDELIKSNTGQYRCCYWQEMGLSEPSRILELKAPDQFPKPIICTKVERYTLPGCNNVNIFCHGWLQDLIFMLFKEGYSETVEYQVPTGTVAIFSIDNMTPENERVYICCTHIQMLPTLWSKLSNPLKLVIAGLYPKPTLTAYPGLIVAPGESLNLRCQGPIYGMTFALMRLEDLEKSFYHKKPIKNEAYFFFQTLKINDAGHYLCFYYDGSYRGSLLSDILKIWVTDKPPKPSLSAWPSTMFKLGKAITLQCRVPHPVLEFSLEREERTISPKFSVDGDFIISNVEGKGIGTYSCSYRIQAYPDIWSHHSEPLKLMGPAGYLTWNYVLNEAFKLSLIVQLAALLLVVLWIRWKCRRLRIRGVST